MQVLVIISMLTSIVSQEKPKIKGEEAIKIVEELRRKLHKELLDVLEAEQKKEAEREENIKKAVRISKSESVY